MHDLVIRGGMIVDGSGREAFPGDVAVRDGRIAAVGRDLGPAQRTLDAEGRIVTPGFVDIHTHYDAQATWDPNLLPSGWHGVTTAVCGNCGVGFAPAPPERRQWLIGLMEGVEDIPGTALAEGMEWGWESFPDYLDALGRREHSLDFATQVPHGAVRAYVMGERGAKNEKATPDEIEQMGALVTEALRAGALGFSSSRTILHRAKDGELVPGTTAGEDELLGIGRAIAKAGHGVFEVASDLAPEGDELAWMTKLSHQTQQPVTFACLQNDLDPEQWRRLLEACERDRAEGGRLTPQVAQRPAGLLLSLQSTAHPFMFSPAYAALAALPLAERVQRMRDPAVRAEILAGRPTGLEGPVAMVLEGFAKMFRLGDPPEYEPAPEASVAATAQREGRDPADVAYDLLLENGGTGFIYLPFLGYSHGNFDAIREMMLHPQAVFGLSDGGAHCGLICDASMPTYLLTHWVRDRTRGERIGLEHIVRCQTRNTAALFGLHDRGALVPGMKADANVIDFENLRIHAPEMVFDLPASARRLVQRVDGYRYTVCSGEVTFENGEPTGAMPGMLIRGPQGL
jgi:N-acyl-D-aspartate/D-glutamate deacylase